MIHINRVLETSLYVNDLEAAERFYRDVLGLQFYSKQPGRHVFFRCGEAMLLLFSADETAGAESELPPHGARGPGHVAFAISDQQWDEWLRQLNEHSIAIEKIVEWPSGGRSMYFRDPAGNSLELALPQMWGLGD